MDGVNFFEHYPNSGGCAGKLGYFAANSRDEDGFLTKTARYDRWILLYGFSTGFSSYFGKVAVRVGLPNAGFAIPSILSPLF